MEQVPKSGWWPRAGAILIDALILSALALLVGIVAAGAGASSDDATLIIYGVVFLASIVYSPVLMARSGAANGQTVGKHAMGIRVVHAEGGPMTVSRGLLRDGVGKAVLGLIPLYTVVDALVPLFDKQNQALHDKVGSTYVVPADATVPAAGLPPADGFTPPASTPHEAWSAAPQPVPPPPPPPGSAPPPLWAPPGPGEPAAAPDAGSPPASRPPAAAEEPPDLGGFAPPVPPPPTPPPAQDDASTRGPFGPSYD